MNAVECVSGDGTCLLATPVDDAQARRVLALTIDEPDVMSTIHLDRDTALSLAESILSYLEETE